MRLIQHKAMISSEYQFDDDFLLAVADGIASSPYSGLVSKKLLALLSKQFKNNAISFQKLQDDLNNHFTQEKYQGAGSTLAMGIIIWINIVLSFVIWATVVFIILII